MERNVLHVQRSRELRDGAREPAGRAVAMAEVLLASTLEERRLERGGRKAYRSPELPEPPVSGKPSAG